MFLSFVINIRLLFCLWLALCLLVPQAASAATETGASAATEPVAQEQTDSTLVDQTVNTVIDQVVTENSLADVWLLRAEDLASVINDTDKLMKNTEGQAAELAAELQSARSKLSRLTGLFQASRGHPTEQLTLVRQLHVLHDNLEQRTRPLQHLAASLSRQLSETIASRQDFETLQKEDAAADQANLTSLNQYRATLGLAEQRLAEASKQLKAAIGPAESLLARLSETVAEMEQSLGGIWEGYYLTPSDADLDALTSTPDLLSAWLNSLDSRLGFAYPHTSDDWLSVAKSFAVTLVIMVLLGFLARHGSCTLPSRWRRACEQSIHSAWVLLGLGLAILMASINQNGGFYFGFIPPGALLLIAGMASLSWRLRVAVLPVLEKQNSPFRLLYLPAALGVIMLFADLPTRVLGLAWGLTILAFLILIFRLKRKLRHDKTPPLERFARSCAFYFGLASLLLAFLGYARLAVLLFIAMFALVNLLILGRALMALLRVLVERRFPEQEKPLRSAIAQALSIPLAWLLSLICVLPWIWAVPGASYLIRNFSGASYTIGGASFNFSRLLLIVLLFFISRSLISLGHASLTSLPDRLPQLERGVIPPLRVMYRYLVWVIFAMTALGLLGVNLTSLAVVAGGLSVGIGLGMQNLFSNLTSGLMLIFGRSILVGDWIDVNGVAGTVKEVNIRSTVLETAERSLVYLPNSNLMAGQFTNWTRGNRYLRQSILVGVSYSADTALAAKLLLDCAHEHPHVLKHPPAAVFFDNFADSALTFKLNVFIDDFDHAPNTLSELRFKINEQFKANGIEIPFPQMDIHLEKHL
ncbi:MAG: mechanosensitive ion channel [Deltaproteobacteria bacterium]|jgi:small-conductance mechanosensitive channel|nr:mechanosensitive ion channel [Deltaproteobacteria bacterium]